ncbi:MAG: hypothetical protein EHM77_06135 [Planctomycetaceae bacterium]|nr:MAG: hypothetical protein EHM77_06135 [Planctomycetaceae bacterium]
MDCLYSSLVHGFPEADARRVCQCFTQLGLPLWDEALNDFERVLAGLEEFRQHLGGRLTVTMLRRVGSPLNVHEIDHAAMREAGRRLRALAEQVTPPTPNHRNLTSR